MGDDKTYTQEEVNSLVDGLKTKKTELEREIAGLKTSVKGLEGIDLQALQKDSEELAKLQKEKLEAEGEYKKLHGQLETDHNTAKEAWEEERTKLQEELKDVRKTSQLTMALSAVPNFIGELTDVAVTTLKDNIAVKDDGSLAVGDLSVPDFVNKWSESEVGKHFLKSGNTGGGGNGSGDNKADADEKYYDKKSGSYNLTQQGRIAKIDPERHKQLKDKFA